MKKIVSFLKSKIEKLKNLTHKNLGGDIKK